LAIAVFGSGGALGLAKSGVRAAAVRGPVTSRASSSLGKSRPSPANSRSFAVFRHFPTERTTPRGPFQAAIRPALLRFGNFQDHYDKVQETGETFRKTVVNSRQFADEEKTVALIVQIISAQALGQQSG
jgi:hypothetical protein